MPSPFPGMDPYLEGAEWPDLHSSLANAIKRLLLPQISPRYTARVNKYIVKDTAPDEDLGIFYPDVELLNLRSGKVEEPAVAYGSSSKLTPPAFTATSHPVIEVPIPFIEIREVENNELVTAVEILSPVNKRAPGLEPYRQKCLDFYSNKVHLLEIDLLRRGKRPFNDPRLADAQYVVRLARWNSREQQYWTMTVKNPLPVVPVPLKPVDPDAILDLGGALNLVYEESFYQHSLNLNYRSEPPLPAFSKEEKVWTEALLKTHLNPT